MKEQDVRFGGLVSVSEIGSNVIRQGWLTYVV